MAISSAKKAVLHVAKSRLQLSDEAYRELLFRVAGVRSSTELDNAAFERVMAEFERLGFRSTAEARGYGKREGMATPAQIETIRRLWRGYIGQENDLALVHWLEKHFGTTHVRFLPRELAGKVIAVLTKMNRHPNAKNPFGRRRAPGNR